MKKFTYVLYTLLFIVILSACSGNSHEQPKLDEESGTATETMNETSEDTYPLVIEAVYLATEELIDREVVLLIEATNISDDEIAVGTTDFSFRNKDDTIEFTRVLRGEEEIILKPNETNVLFNYQSAPDDLDIDSIDLDDFQVTYTGIHYNNHEPMPIDRMIPENYQAKVDQVISDLKERIAMIEAERMEDSTMENEDPIRITGYQAATNGSIYIRVENLTDEEFYFDANYLKIFDYAYEYEVDTSQRDSGFDPTVTIPPHGKFDYKQFYILSNPDYSDKDEIVESMYGVHYKTEWPMAVEYDIYGNYEKQLPEDFSMDW